MSNCFLGIQSIIVDNNVMMWAHILDWIPINMTNQDEAQSIMESFLLPAFYGLVYTTFGALSPILPEKNPTYTKKRYKPFKKSNHPKQKQLRSFIDMVN